MSLFFTHASRRFITLTVIFLVILGGALLAGYQSKLMVQDGLAVASQGEYQRAEQTFRDALRWNPLNVNAYVEAAIALERQNNFDGAYQMLNKVGWWGDGDLRWKSELGKVARYVGRLDESEKLLKEVLKELPNDGLTHFRLGHVYYDQNRFKEAKLEYEKAVLADPGSAQFRSALGAALTMLGEDREATVQLERALQLDPKFPGTHNNLAELYLRQGQFDLALEHANTAVSLNPDKPEYYMTQGDAFAAKGEKDKARISYEKARDLLTLAPAAAQVLRDNVGKSLEALELTR